MESAIHATSPSSSRKRPRENETESQRLKREKAAERQRRKRERDRQNNAGMGMMAFQSAEHQQHLPPQHHQPQHHQQVQHHPQPQSHSVHVQQGTQPDYTQPELSPEEATRRDRVRAAARERQRKHRQLVKQRKLRELGLDMGNEIMPGMEEVHYRVGSDGQYQQVMPHELQLQQQQQPPAIGGPHEPPFPQGQPLGGQTFASTLLLSFSCAPLLKQHLLRTLNMSNEELASLEPVLAEAWERWDHARRAHYAEQAAKAGLPPTLPGPPPYPVDLSHDQQQQQQHAANPYSIPTNGPADSPHPTTNEFRARFHRPLIAPTPFRTYTGDGQAGASASAPTSASGSAPSTADPIDPHLGASSTGAAGAGAGTASASGGTGGNTAGADESRS